MNNTITRLQTLDVDVPLSLKARLVAIPFLLALLPAQSAWAQDATIEYPEKSMHPVRTFVATDPEGAVVPSWSLSGVDAEDFSIEDGVLSFKSPPDFEKAGDADQNNIYSVDVVASDGSNSSKENVMVEVTDVEEAGKITFSALQPQAGTQFTAELNDPDGGDSETIWQWAKSTTKDGSYTDIAANARSANYTPTDDDDLHYLRAMASYSDDEGPGKTAMMVSDYPVQRIHGTNHAPTFTAANLDLDLEVDENTPGGRALGRPIMATDRNNDILTYTIVPFDTDNPDAAAADGALFAVDRATGQLKTMGALDFESESAGTDDTYRVTVKATDPAGIPSGDASTNTSNSATIAVTIDVTDVDEAPDVTSIDTGVVSFQERVDTTTAIGEVILRAFTGTEPDVRDSVHEIVDTSWQVGGPDGSKFNVTTTGTPGQLTFKADPNFEAPGDADKNNVYEVTVSVESGPAGGGRLRGSTNVKVMVTDDDEAGTLTLSKFQPRIGLAVKATLSDPDGNLSGVTWEWYRADATDATDTDPLSTNAIDATTGAFNMAEATIIENANSDTYTPIPEDFLVLDTSDPPMPVDPPMFAANQVLIAVAKYTDGHDAQKTAVFPSMRVVGQDTRNRAPAFDDQDDDTDGLQNMYTERTVAEDGTIVGRPVRATDPDPNEDDLEYTLGGPDAAVFNVSQPSATSMGGQITVSGKLDYETRTTYNVTVTAEDSFGESSSIMVTIMVTDVNESPEIVLGDAATVAYVENDMAMVATYTATDPEDEATLTWSVSGADAAKFSIEDGVLSFKSPPNFEAKASADGDNEYSVNVVVSDGPNTAKKAVTVNVTNDDEDGMVTLSALQPEAGTALTATLTDPDSLTLPGDDVIGPVGVTWQWARSTSMSGSFANIANATSETYSPVDGDENFYLRATASYTDDEGAGKTAMRVSDNKVQRIPSTDDTTPTFPEADVALNLNENTPAGRALGSPIKAKDNDILTYTLVLTEDSVGNVITDGRFFDIDRATGQLMTKKALNFETPETGDRTGTGNEYTVTVKATDPGGIPTAEFDPILVDDPNTPGNEVAATTKVVTIMVLDVNEGPGITGAGAVTFVEATPIDDEANMHEYIAEEPESGDTVETATWKVGGPDGGKFNVTTGGTTSELTFKAAPNFEAPGDADKNNIYEVTVSVADNNGNIGTKGVKVTVMDANEVGKVTLSKIQPRVGIAVKASLSDPDGNLSGLTWEWWTDDTTPDVDLDPFPLTDDDLTDTDGKIADALADTYVPVMDDLLDASDAAQFLIAVAKYTDGHGEGKVAYATSRNRLKEDTRNSAPMFADQDYDAHGVQNTLTVRSVAEDGRFVGRVVMARDPDPNADTLVYTLGGDDAALFEVNEHGQITVSGKLDYETRTTYSVTVIGTDSFGVSSSIMVNIRVTDVNEPPVIMLGGLAISGLASVDYAEDRMDAVVTYTAVGPGAASAAWTLEGADADIFSITDGVLTFNAMPDYEAPADATMNNVYVVRVNANDGTYSATHDVTVIVTDVDEVVFQDYGPGEDIVGMPTGDWTPDVQSRASHEIVGSASTVTFEHGGRIEAEGITYTCLTSGGCTIEGIGVVTGMVQASMTADAMALLAAGMGEQKDDGIMFMGYTYNGFELRGSTVTLRSVAGEVTRLSFLDINGDVVFVDFSSDSSDTEVSVTLEDYMDPLDGSPYNQPDSWYAMGLATVHVVNPTAMTWLKVTSIGNDPMLVDPMIVKEDDTTFMTANGWAEIRAIDVHHDAGMGSIGAIHAANVSFVAMDGVIGIDAMDTVVMMALSIGDLTIPDMGTAMAYLRISGDSLAMGDMVIEEILIAGGDLAQSTGDNQVDTGGEIFKIMAVDGMGTIDAMVVPAATETFVTNPDDYFMTDGQMIVMEEEMASN